MDIRHPTPEACAQLMPHHCASIQGERGSAVVFLYEHLSGGWAVGALTLPENIMSVRAWGGPSCDLAEGLEQYAQLVQTSKACLGTESAEDTQLSLAQEVELTIHWTSANQLSPPLWAPDSYETWKRTVCQQASERNRALYGPPKDTTTLLLRGWQSTDPTRTSILDQLPEGERATILQFLLQADVVFPEGAGDGLRTLRDRGAFDFCLRLGDTHLKAIQGCIDAVLWHQYGNRAPRFTVGDLVTTLLQPLVPDLLQAQLLKNTKA